MVPPLIDPLEIPLPMGPTNSMGPTFLLNLLFTLADGSGARPRGKGVGRVEGLAGCHLSPLSPLKAIGP